MRECIVDPAESGIKLLSFLEKRLSLPETSPEASPEASPEGPEAPPRTMLHRWVRTGQVRVNGKRAKPFDRLEGGDRVRIPPFAAPHPPGPPGGDAPRPPENGELLGPLLRISMATPAFLVLEKGGGLATQPGSGHTDSVVSLLAARFAGAAYIPAPAHRLDKNASGLILAGRTFAAQRALSEAFAAGDGGAVRKEYLAWVRGIWPHAGECELRDHLYKGRGTPEEPEREKVRSLALGNGGDGGGGDPARESECREAACRVRPLRVLESSPAGAATLMHIELFTGRTHQIRVQFSSRGHPLLGDGKYGGPFAPCLMLHAWRLSIRVPSRALFPDGLAQSVMAQPSMAEPFVAAAAPSWPAPFSAP